MERALGMAKFYRMAWYELCVKWNAMMHANAPKVLSLYKTGRSGKVYAKKIYAGDWKSTAGYEPIVVSSSEQEQESVKTIQKFMFLLQQFPENMALKDIAQKRMLQSVDLSPDELKQVETSNQPQQAQEQPIEQAQQPTMQNQMTPDIQEMISQLAA
jgi:hypothetical protein